VENMFLPPPVMDWYGFEDSNPVLDDRETHPMPMAVLNDEAEWEFRRIAAVLRKQYDLDGDPEGD